MIEEMDTIIIEPSFLLHPRQVIIVRNVKGDGTSDLYLILRHNHSSFNDNYCLFSRHDMYTNDIETQPKNRQHPVARRTNALELENMRD